jgi:hypothetical protein
VVKGTRGSAVVAFAACASVAKFNTSLENSAGAGVRNEVSSALSNGTRRRPSKDAKLGANMEARAICDAL